MLATLFANVASIHNMLKEMLQAMKWIYCLILVISLCSCRSVKYVPVVSVRVDSVAIKDTLFEVKLIPYKDSIATKDTASYLANAYAYSWARYSRGMLYHSLGIFPLAQTQIRIPYFVERYRYIEKPTIVEVEKKLSQWQKLKIELGGYAIGMIIAVFIALIGWMIYKKIKK